MKYITVAQAADLCGQSTRTIQKWAKMGKLPGAIKGGRDWLIPEASIQFANQQNDYILVDEGGLLSSNVCAMPLINSSFTPGDALKRIESMKDPTIAAISMAEYHQFRGEYKQSLEKSEPLITDSDPMAQLSALFLHSFASLGLGLVDLTTQDLEILDSTMVAEGTFQSKEEEALMLFLGHAPSILLNTSDGSGKPFENLIRYLPTGMKLLGLFGYANLWYRAEDYNRSIGILHGALSLTPAVFPIPHVYIHLLLSANYMAIKDLKEGRRHFDIAWDIGRPDGFFQPFAEHHGLLHGLLEVVLKDSYPEEYNQITATTYKFAAGWRELNNYSNGDRITGVLTAFEFSLATLASKGWTNKQIADYMGMSPSSVKNYLATIYQKLGVDSRKDLKDHLLR